jgi:hypothetical protein
MRRAPGRNRRVSPRLLPAPARSPLVHSCHPPRPLCTAVHVSPPAAYGVAPEASTHGWPRRCRDIEATIECPRRVATRDHQSTGTRTEAHSRSGRDLRPPRLPTQSVRGAAERVEESEQQSRDPESPYPRDDVHGPDRRTGGFRGRTIRYGHQSHHGSSRSRPPDPHPVRVRRESDAPYRPPWAPSDRAGRRVTAHRQVLPVWCATRVAHQTGRPPTVIA